MRELTLQAQPYQGERHEKAWGHELWIINNDLYCGKLLVFKKDKQFSMHFHLLKDEAWYISKGEFLYKWIDTETATEHETHVKEGDCIHLMPGQPHQMLALTEGATIFEVSTQHFDYDSYRIKPGASQSTPENTRGKVFYTKGGETVDIRNWDQTLDIVSMGDKYGWEGAMAYGNLVHDELNEHGPGIKPGDVFLDLGANIGMSSLRAELSGASKIYCVEPDPGVFEALEMNKADNWELDNIAISDKEEMIDISLWPNYWEFGQRQAYTLEQYFEQKGIEHVDYMKVDIEGHEHRVLPSIPVQIYNKIEKIFIEYHEDTNLPDEERNKKRENFILELLNKGYNNHHVALGYYQSYIYIWK